MPDRLSASARLAGKLTSAPMPVLSVKREGRVLTWLAVWCAPISARIAGAQLHLLAAAIELGSEGRGWSITCEPSTTAMTATGWRWGSLVLVLSAGTDDEIAAARLVLDTALRDFASRVQHGR